MNDDLDYDRVLNSIDLHEDGITVHYDRACENTKRKDGLICFVFDGKQKCFDPDKTDVDTQNNTITISREDAIKRGFE